MSDPSILLLIIGLSVVQSLLGVGLLVFGTPTLLLLGVSFPDALSVLLPPSLVISTLQVIESQFWKHEFRRHFNVYCLPFVFIGLVVALQIAPKWDIHLGIGVMLLLSGAMRLSHRTENVLVRWIQRHKNMYSSVMGAVHGLTNLGGGLLVMFSAAIHQTKEDRRNGIAYGYLCMGLVQYVTLVVLESEMFTGLAWVGGGVAASTYGLVGQRLFRRSEEKGLNHIITAVILVYGVCLLLR